MLSKIAVFVAVTGGLLYLSRVALKNRDSHGFYRFFAWEAILLLTLRNFNAWFVEPFTPLQIISWLCLAISLFLVIESVRLLHQFGKADGTRTDRALLGIEKTTVLVTSGLYRYIRHPMYSSLLFLAWGVFCKSPSWLGGSLAIVAMLFLNAAAKVEEAENIRYFGTLYSEYMKKTKLFIPFVY